MTIRNGIQLGATLHVGPVALLVLFAAVGCDRRGAAPAPPPAPSAVGSPEESVDGTLAAAMNEGTALMGQFRYQEAWQVFSAQLARHPDHAGLLVNAAIARLNLAGDEDLAAAMELLERVLKRDPQDLRANYVAGLIKMYLGPPHDALPHFRIAAAQAPDDPDAAFLLARALEQGGDRAGAEQEFQRCLKLDGYCASAMLGLSRLAGMSGQRQEAERWISQFERMKANPNCRVFEFAYKRMGRLGEVVPLEGSTVLALRPLPDGELFAPARELGRLATPFATGDTVAVTAADFDGDGRLDLAIHPVGLDGDSRIQVLVQFPSGQFGLTPDWPWAVAGPAQRLLCGDLDGNGLNDVVICGPEGLRVWLQGEDRGWEPLVEPLFQNAGGVVAGLLCDADHDGDLDIVRVPRNGPAGILNNNRDGSWRELGESDGFPGPADMEWIAAGDLDNRRDLDLILGNGTGQGTVLLNQRLWRFEPDPFPGRRKDGGFPGTAVCADIDQDGWLDLVGRFPEELIVWSRGLDGDWRETAGIPLPVLLREETGNDPPDGRLVVADLDGDGDCEFVASGGGKLCAFDRTGSVHWTMDGTRLQGGLAGWNLVALSPHEGWSLVVVDGAGGVFEYPPGPGRHPFVAVRFSGQEDLGSAMRSNRSGIGTRWKARAGDRWLTGSTLPADSLPGQSAQPVLIGTGGHGQLDFLAIDWSDGVFQMELALRPGETSLITETQRQLASCPLLFAWNGEQHEFVTDVLGVGGIGFMVAPGVWGEPRPWESVWLDARLLRPRDGRLEIKLGEPMEEACYVRSAELYAVSVPEGWEVVIDERMAVNGPQPDGQPRLFRHAAGVAWARDAAGGDATAALAEADGVPPDPGPLDHRFIGLLRDEQVLEFGFAEPVGDRGSPALVIDGWIEYPYSQTVFAAAQAGRKYTAPTLEGSADGKSWETIHEQWGYPAGMPRTCLLPLPPKAVGMKAFRLRSPMQVYWDRIRLVTLEDCPDALIRSLPLQRAELRWSGFATRTTRDWFRPHYNYRRRTGTWDARHLPGGYTPFGEITGRLSDGTGPLTVFGPGEEIHFEFAAPEDDSDARAGYWLRLRGWCKDLDLYTATGDALGPVPEADGEGTLSAEQAPGNWRYESGPWYSAPGFPAVMRREIPR